MRKHTSNLSIIASIGIEAYNSPLKFQTDCIYVSKDTAFLKSWFSHTFCMQSVLRLLGVTNVLMHETIRITNMCH